MGEPPREPPSSGPGTPSAAPPGWPHPQAPMPAGSPSGAVASAGTDPSAGRDSLVVHLVWEGVLALITVGLVSALLITTPGPVFTGLLAQAGPIGLVATALALSMRTASPNLAVGSIAVGTGALAAYLTNQQDWALPVALAVAVALATVIGLVLGALVAVLSVPAWAVTLGGATVIDMAVVWLADGRTDPVDISMNYPTALWFGLFAVVSVGGGLLWLVPGLRRALSATRRAGEPAGRHGRHGRRAGLGALAGLTGSSLLAGLAGVALLMRVEAVQPGSDQSMTIAALAAVLLGGVSVFGRRGGVLGTFLGVLAVLSVQFLFIFHDLSSWLGGMVVGMVVLLGLGVNRLLESSADRVSRPVRAPLAAPGQVQGGGGPAPHHRR